MGIDVVSNVLGVLEGDGNAGFEAASEEQQQLTEEEAVLAEEESGLQSANTYTCSFTPSTVVTTSHGKQAIGTMHVGEQVLAYNSKMHKMELEPVEHVWIHTDNDLVDLTITTTTHAPHSTVGKKSNEVLHTTEKHPFFTLEHGFVPVQNLMLGMHVLQADGQIGVITGRKVVPGTKVMYNLEVAQDHTFTVGDGQWVVHNSCGFVAGDETPGGLQFTDHGAGQANDRNFTAQSIDNIVRNTKGQLFQDSEGRWSWRYQDSRGNVVILNSTKEAIVTVYSYPRSANSGNYIPNSKGN